MIDVRKLRMLADLERLGTIAAVAKSLNLTAPGVSMQLSSLERELGVVLTERQGRRVVVTPAGRLLARHGSAIVDLLTIAETEVVALREGAAGSYRVAAFPTAARSIFPAAWTMLASADGRGPQMRLIEMEPSTSIPALIAGEVELAVAHHYSNLSPIPEAGLVVTPIAVESVRLAVSTADRSVVADAPVDLAHFAAHDWIVPGREWSCHEMVHRATDLAGFEPRGVAEATDFAVQLALVAEGVGVALIPELGARDIPRGVALLELRNPVSRHIAVVSRPASSGDAGLTRISAAISAVASDALHPVAG